jgi:hypothetical protein
MTTSATVLTTPAAAQSNDRFSKLRPTELKRSGKGPDPGSVPTPSLSRSDGSHPLRMYTEAQVSEMLQVSLSHLRKWRMKQNSGKPQGPPFKKVGRLVRYPERGLYAYINGE